MDSHDALDLAQAEVVAQIALRSMEQKYFSDIEPISSIEVVDDHTSASCYLPKSKAIRLNFAIARFARLAQFLILHELVHHKLFMQDPSYADHPYGEPFRLETQQLLKLGAYDNLL